MKSKCLFSVIILDAVISVKDTFKHYLKDERSGFDIHGFKLGADVSESAMCPVCTRPVVVTRFAPHLEKCMGLKTSRSVRIKKYTSIDKLIQGTR